MANPKLAKRRKVVRERKSNEPEGVDGTTLSAYVEKDDSKPFIYYDAELQSHASRKTKKDCERLLYEAFQQALMKNIFIEAPVNAKPFNNTTGFKWTGDPRVMFVDATENFTDADGKAGQQEYLAVNEAALMGKSATWYKSTVSGVVELQLEMAISAIELHDSLFVWDAPERKLYFAISKSTQPAAQFASVAKVYNTYFVTRYNDFGDDLVVDTPTLQVVDTMSFVYGWLLG